MARKNALRFERSEPRGEADAVSTNTFWMAFQGEVTFIWYVSLSASKQDPSATRLASAKSIVGANSALA